MLLELIDDVIVEYPDTKEQIQQKLQYKCKREGIQIDTVSFSFLASFSEAKNIFTNQAYHNVFIVIYKKILFSVLYLFA